MIGRAGGSLGSISAGLARRALAFAAFAAIAGCGDELPPLGEALLVIDTDLPVPRLAGAVRVDLYDADDGRWYLSREIRLPDPRDWPTSFSLYDPDDARARSVTVRLRGYAQGKQRDYHGERFAPRPSDGDPAAPAPIPPVPADEGPRLLDDGGADVTPPHEPEPLVTVDRLLRVDLEPGRRGKTVVTLAGACTGTMADLAGGTTCVDTQNVRVAAPTAELEADMSRPTSSAQGSFAPLAPCSRAPRAPRTAADGTPLFDDEACAGGGAFVFGNLDRFGGYATSALPERLAVLPPFLIDRFEVTVGRFRDAVARGFVPPDPTPARNDGPLATEPAEPPSKFCTYSAEPLGREAFPLSCVSVLTAEAFCAFEGGALPTEAQWEYVAQAAGRPAKTRYPWGQADPTCDRAVFGRGGGGLFGAEQCLDQGVGPLPVDARAHEGGDVSLGLGVVGLGGSLAEIAVDAYRSMASVCWARTPLESPSCLDPTASLRTVRGGNWGDPSSVLNSGGRFGLDTTAISAGVGLRCVRPG